MVDKHAASDRHGGMDIDGKDLGHAAGVGSSWPNEGLTSPTKRYGAGC